MSNKKHFLSFLFLIIVFTSFILPPKRAQAFLGIADFGFTIDVVQEAIKITINAAAHTLQRMIVQQLVQSTVTWANSGFEGNPQYSVNLKQDIQNVANNSATAFITNLGQNPNLLCSPFRANITISLKNYYTPTSSFQCTFTGIAANLTNFYNNFSNGGWDTWYQVTQVPQDNPYQVYVDATQQIDTKVSASVDIANKKFQANSGFLDVASCAQKNPDQATMDRINAWRNGSNPSDSQAGSQGYMLYQDDTDSASLKQNQAGGYILYNPDIPAGNCIARGDVQTPGTVIANQINSTIHSPLDQLVNAKDWDEVVSALVAGLTKRIFTSATGLFTKGNPTAGLPSGSEAPNIAYSGPTSSNSGTSNTTGGSTGGSTGTGGGASGGGGGGGIACSVSAQTPTGANQDIVTWSIDAGLSGTVDYLWQGDNIATASNYDQTLGYAKGNSIIVTYSTAGTKNMEVIASTTSSTSGLPTLIGPVSCQPVNVVGGLNSPAT